MSAWSESMSTAMSSKETCPCDGFTLQPDVDAVDSKGDKLIVQSA